MGRTGRRLECREGVRWGEQDGEDRKEVRVPGEGQVGEQDGEDRKEVRVPGEGQVGGTGWGGQEGG